ncbi:hypothetical protein SKAU_G00056610 [Synaphobranchus kaupii]|uniref:Uncharacterized protein n=1 Tax=Synaphobranchus kaupii TaxID=118154 RepID=A0A9Q1G4X7_SYNKA|nr:hypothetical protein SKAU_G00056610 [Synaphobranchus kaupii]
MGHDKYALSPKVLKAKRTLLCSLPPRRCQAASRVGWEEEMARAPRKVPREEERGEEGFEASLPSVPRCVCLTLFPRPQTVLWCEPTGKHPQQRPCVGAARICLGRPSDRGQMSDLAVRLGSERAVWSGAAVSAGFDARLRQMLGPLSSPRGSRQPRLKLPNLPRAPETARKLVERIREETSLFTVSLAQLQGI